MISNIQIPGQLAKNKINGSYIYILDDHKQIEDPKDKLLTHLTQGQVILTSDGVSN
jgi:hypothetical protein